MHRSGPLGRTAEAEEWVVEAACDAPGSSARRGPLVRFLSRDDAEDQPGSGTRGYAQHRWPRGAPDFAHDLWFVRTSDRWALRHAGVGRPRCASNRYSIGLRSDLALLPNPSDTPGHLYSRTCELLSTSPRLTESRRGQQLGRYVAYWPLVQYLTSCAAEQHALCCMSF